MTKWARSKERPPSSAGKSLLGPRIFVRPGTCTCLAFRKKRNAKRQVWFYSKQRARQRPVAIGRFRVTKEGYTRIAPNGRAAAMSRGVHHFGAGKSVHLRPPHAFEHTPATAQFHDRAIFNDFAAIQDDD